jgi:hypothetical protein
MRLAWSAACLLLIAAESRAADTVYLDQLMETPLADLQRSFHNLKRGGCYRLGAGRFLMIEIERKEQKPWRVVLTSSEPCRHADAGPDLEVRERRGIQLGDTTPTVIEKLGRPDASAEPEPGLRELGQTEYFYICRVSEGCARHTSVFLRDGAVSAIAEWYSN